MRLAFCMGLLALAFAAPAAARPTPADEPPPAGPRQFGGVILQPCPRAAAFCGQISRKLDPSGRVKGDIPIAFILYAHTGPGATAGTIVAQEGGPGLPSIGSRGAYLALYASLRVDHDLLMVDARGTGDSGVIDCPELQTQGHPIWYVGACGRSQGVSVLYGTGLAVDDMVAVLDALGIGQVDYYGDSYGTFFGQVLAARHPGVAAVVLTAYPVIGDPWYPERRRDAARSDEACWRCAGPAPPRPDRQIGSRPFAALYRRRSVNGSRRNGTQVPPGDRRSGQPRLPAL